MKKEFKTKTEKDQLLEQIVEHTFSKLSCRMAGVGMYHELKEAIRQAYKLGKYKRKKLKEQRVIELLPMNLNAAQ